MKSSGSLSDPCVVLSTCPDEATAEGLARALVRSRLAACVNIVAGIRSVYEWQGRIEDGAEVLLVIKTAASRFPAIKELVEHEHPYEVPELILLEVSDGSPAYLRWMAGLED